jgi:RNA polymerase sigma factor (sigma-70 family)
MKISDSLLRSCAKQNRRAEYKLYKMLFGVLMGVAMRYENNEEDGVALVNKAYLKILQNLAKFLKDNPTSRFEFWSRRVMINTAIDEYRKKRKRMETTQTTDWQEKQDYSGPVDYNSAMDQLTAEDLQQMLMNLSEMRRNVFNLFAIDGYAHKEIAQMLGISEGNSKWHLSIARKELQAMIGQQMGMEIMKVK